MLIGAMLGAYACVGRSTTATAEDQATELRVRSLVIVDNDGRPRITLSVNAEGRAEIVLNDKRGKPKVMVFADPLVESGALIGPSQSCPDVDLRSFEGYGHLTFWDKTDAKLSIGTTSSGSSLSAVATHGTFENNPQFELSVRDEGGILLQVGRGALCQEGLQLQVPGDKSEPVELAMRRNESAVWSISSDATENEKARYPRPR